MSPTKGIISWPIIPIATVAMTDKMVNPITHGFRRCVMSDSVPNTGIDNMTSAEEIPFPNAMAVLEACKSDTSHTAKYNVATFMEKTVVAKS
jgi:hypothetical protein